MLNPDKLDGYPVKYFTVPKDEPFDYDAHEILLEQIEAVNEIITNISNGSEVGFSEYIVGNLCNIMESLLYQAKLIRDASIK